MAGGLGLYFILRVLVVDVAAHASRVHSCRERLQVGVGGREGAWDSGWGPGATLTLGSKEYSIARLVAVGLAVMLGTGWG